MGSWTTQVLPPEYTLENYRRLFSESELWRPITNSVSMALIATAANLVVCFLAAYLIVFRRFSGRGLLELLVALPWAIPATAIALGLAATFNRNDLADGPSAAGRDVLDIAAGVLHPGHPSRRVCRRVLAPTDGCIARGCCARARCFVAADDATGDSTGGATWSGSGRLARGGNRSRRVRGERRAVHAREPADLDGDPGSAARSGVRNRGGLQCSADISGSADDACRALLRGKTCLRRRLVRAS